MPFTKGDPRINRNGASTKEKLVSDYRAAHPETTKYRAAKDLKVSLTTIYKWWDSDSQNPIKN